MFVHITKNLNGMAGYSMMVRNTVGNSSVDNKVVGNSMVVVIGSLPQILHLSSLLGNHLKVRLKTVRQTHQKMVPQIRLQILLYRSLRLIYHVLSVINRPPSTIVYATSSLQLVPRLFLN